MDPTSFQTIILNFTGILYEAMPFIILGVVIAGLLEELVPSRVIAQFIPRNRLLAVAIGGWLGVLFPMCECGIIVVMRRLLRKGVPLSVCVCYMLAGPIINVVVMLSTFVAFSGDKTVYECSVPLVGLSFDISFPWLMTTLRMGLGFLVAFNTALIVEWQFRKHGNKLLSPRSIGEAEAGAVDEDAGPRPRKTLLQRLSAISETALHDFVDVTVYLIIGALLASITRVILPRSAMEEVLRNYPQLGILLMMGLAILLCICSEADAFVAASFVSVPASGKLAFLVLGPMLDFKLYMMYTRVFRPRLIWTIILVVIAQVFLLSLLTHYLLETELLSSLGIID
jgi:uncharacterized membrane protein YraQ (UPF0718 family)